MNCGMCLVIDTYCWANIIVWLVPWVSSGGVAGNLGADGNFNVSFVFLLSVVRGVWRNVMVLENPRKNPDCLSEEEWTARMIQIILVRFMSGLKLFFTLPWAPSKSAHEQFYKCHSLKSYMKMKTANKRGRYQILSFKINFGNLTPSSTFAY